MTTRPDRYNVMIGPAKTGKGGISTVITQYEEHVFFEKLNSQYWDSWKSGSSLKKVATILSVIARLMHGLLFRKIRVVHVHSACRISFLRKSLFIAIASLLKAPSIFHLHSGEFFERYKTGNFLVKWWVRLTLNRCAAVLLLSEGWISEARLIVKNPRKIYVISNPIGLKLPADFKRKPRVAGELKLLFLGEIGDRKGLFDLIPVLAALRKKGVNVTLRCGGNGQLERLANALKEYQLGDAFEFLGWINQEQKISEFAAADAFILPSHYEGQPMAILEAMMAEILVISTTAGSIPDTITDGREGFLFKPGDQSAMQALLEKIYGDIHCGDTIIRNAKIRVEREHNPQSILNKLLDLYSDIDPAASLAEKVN